MSRPWFARLSILGLSALFLACAFVSAGRKEEAKLGIAVASALDSLDASRAALQRCQLMREPDDACLRLWADNRRRFLTYSSHSR